MGLVVYGYHVLSELTATPEPLIPLPALDSSKCQAYCHSSAVSCVSTCRRVEGNAPEYVALAPLPRLTLIVWARSLPLDCRLREHAACLAGCDSGIKALCHLSCEGTDCTGRFPVGKARAEESCRQVCNPMFHTGVAAMHPACVDGCNSLIEDMCALGYGEFWRLSEELRAFARRSKQSEL